MDDKSKAIEKIKKFLALSKSSNPNEAAAALKFAQTLIEKHGIGEDDLNLADVGEVISNIRLKAQPAYHSSILSQLVARAFGVGVLAVQDYDRSKARFTLNWRYHFYGLGHRPMLADYTFTVLHRQLVAARDAHLKTISKRLKKSTRTRRADVFAAAWVNAVAKMVQVFASSDAEQALLKLWYQKNHASAQTKEVGLGSIKRRELNSAAAGFAAAKDVTLNHGVNGAADRQLLLGTH